MIAADNAGSVNRTSAFAAIDLAPSLLAIAGVKPPSNVAFDGAALPEVLTGGCEVWAYASVVDNGSGDPTTVPVVVE